MPCKKCGEKYGIMVHENNGILCVNCHPDYFNPMNAKQVLEHLINKMELDKTSNRIYQENE